MSNLVTGEEEKCVLEIKRKWKRLWQPIKTIWRGWEGQIGSVSAQLEFLWFIAKARFVLQWKQIRIVQVFTRGTGPSKTGFSLPGRGTKTTRLSHSPRFEQSADRYQGIDKFTVSKQSRSTHKKAQWKSRGEVQESEHEETRTERAKPEYHTHEVTRHADKEHKGMSSTCTQEGDNWAQV